MEKLKKFRNDNLYEIEPDSIGIWRFYNKSGELIKKINFQD